MKSKLIIFKTLFISLFFAGAVLSSASGYGQSYLGLNGGFEGTATIDNTVQTSAQAGKWTKNNASQTIADETSVVRSGGHSLSATNSTTTGRRIWSPLMSVSSTTSSVTLQFYRRTATITNNQQSMPGVGDGTTTGDLSSGTYSFPSAANTYEKVTYTRSSWTYTNIAAAIFTRMNGTAAGMVYIDDVAMYAGAVDVTAPGAPTAGSPTVAVTSPTSLTVSWAAPGTGTDNGGYLVVKGTSDPSTAPNVNGIYAVNNTVAAGMTVAYQGTNTSFVDGSLTTGTTYYYRIYTYDKAYNYSSALTGNGTPIASGTPTINVGTIAGFGNQTVNTTSGEKSYSITGTDLTNNVIIKPPVGFWISTTSGSGFITYPDSITLTPVGNSVSGTIYVKFKPVAVTAYSGNITHTSTGATSQNVACSGTGTAVGNPLTFTAVTGGPAQINLTATANANSDNIVVAYNATGTFSPPVDGVAAGNAGDAFAGGTIWYKGAASSLTNHTGLAGGQTVYYKTYSMDAYSFYSSGMTAYATTLKGEPTNYPISFSAVQGTPSYSDIQLSWTDATGGTVPDGYLVKGSSVGYSSIADPVDGVTEPNGTLVENVVAGTGSHNFTSLSSSTPYYFKIFPYTNTGTNINYKFDGVVPEATATTTVRPWIEDFEVGKKAGFAISTDTTSMGIWTMDEALVGNLAADHKNGTWAVRMRNSNGSIYMNFDKANGAGTVTVYHAKYGTDGNSTWKLQKSTDGGANWIDMGSTITTSTITLTPQTFSINQPGNVRFKIVHISGGSANRLNIDDITITDFTDPVITNSITTGNWSDASTWDNGIPGDATNVVIAPGTTVTLNVSDSCNNLNIAPAAAFIINSGKRIGVTQKFTIKSDATGTGSLIDQNTSSAINGAVDIERFVHPVRWTFISSPVTNAVSNIFLHAWLKDYNEHTCLWNNPSTLTTTPLTTGKGFALWDSTTNGKTFVYSGVPNMGDITPTILADTGFKLVGNPYTSAVSWNDAGWIKTQIGATIYTWDGSNYATWNGSTGNLISGIIPSGQAFFVYSSGTTPVLTIPKSARVNSTQAFYKSTLSDLLVLTANGNGYSDQTFINFNMNATSGFDQQFDGFKLWGIDEAPQLYSYNAGQSYSINVLPAINPPLTVSVGFFAGVSGNYSITASELGSFDQNIPITLEDLKTSQITDLRQNPVYNFTASNTDDHNRFLVHFGRSTTGIDNPVKNDVMIYSSAGNIYINSNGTEGNVYIYDMLGRELASEKLKASALNNFKISHTGYYLVKVVTPKNVSVKKVLCTI